MWQVDVLSAEDARSGADDRVEQAKADRVEQQVASDRVKVVNAMEGYPAGETSRTIRIASGMAPARFDRVLHGLTQDGSVVECKVQKACRKAPYDGYKLVER